MNYQVSKSLEEITVPESRLRELQDYSGLAESMSEVGLLQPITVTESGWLVAGRHRLEAAKSLGWRTIPAFIVEDDDLRNRLAEIDENLRRLDLTVYEQSKHAEERERVLEAMGKRREAGRHPNPATVAGLNETSDQKTTAEVARESGISERSWQGRVKIGKSLGPKTRAALDQADPTDEKQRNFLNSTTQLNTVADIANKRGDDTAAEAVERVLNGQHGSVYDAYPEMKRERAEPEDTTPPDEPLAGEDRTPLKEKLSGEAADDLQLPRWGLSKEQQAYWNISKHLVALSRLDPKLVAEQVGSEEDADKRLSHVDGVLDWFTRYRTEIEKKQKELRPGNLRAIGGGRG